MGTMSVQTRKFRRFSIAKHPFFIHNRDQMPFNQSIQIVWKKVNILIIGWKTVGLRCRQRPREATGQARSNARDHCPDNPRQRLQPAPDPPSPASPSRTTFREETNS